MIYGESFEFGNQSSWHYIYPNWDPSPTAATCAPGSAALLESPPAARAPAKARCADLLLTPRALTDPQARRA
jgi:hypothetical protein